MIEDGLSYRYHIYYYLIMVDHLLHVFLICFADISLSVLYLCSNGKLICNSFILHSLYVVLV